MLDTAAAELNLSASRHVRDYLRRILEGCESTELVLNSMGLQDLPVMYAGVNIWHMLAHLEVRISVTYQLHIRYISVTYQLRRTRWRIWRYANEPCETVKEPHFTRKEPHFTRKEPHSTRKEPHFPRKEPHFTRKEPHFTRKEP